ncbi:MAG: NADH-quinone oxidoreductase subunit L, partial [Acidobacteria bacterium]
MLEYIWLIPVLPAVGALINGLFGKKLPKNFIHILACGVVGLAFILSVICVANIASLDREHRVYEKDYYTWIPGG